MAADVYAFGCLAFELLTGRVLFEASSDAAMVAAHLDHDGQPPALIPMLEDGRLSALGKWLSQCLRRDPAARASARQLREGLAGLEELLRNQPWPLSAPVEPSF